MSRGKVVRESRPAATARARVVHVGPLPPPIGGMASNVERFLQSEVVKAFDVQHVRSDLIGKYRASGIRRRFLNVVNGVLLCAALCWSLIRFRPAIVHIRTNSFGGFFEKGVLALLGRLAGRKVIMHVHGGALRTFYEQSPRPLRWLIRACLRLNHLVVAISAQMRQVLIDIGLAPGRIAVVENAVFVPPVDVWHRRDAASGASSETSAAVTVLFLNRIDVNKGVLDLVESVGLIHRRVPGLRLRIVGDGSPACGMVRDRVARLALSECVELAGPATGEARDAAFLGADVYVLPSYVEGLPNGLLEAMSFGLACIATPVGGVPSVVQDNSNGILVPPRDINALAAAIERLALEPQLRRRLGTRARETVERRFNWETSARRLIELYNSLLAA